MEELWRPLPRQGKSQALVERIRLGIEQGRYRSGDRLPASRVLARDLGVSRNVVLAAYAQLQAEGYIRSRQGSGTRVQRKAFRSSSSPTPPGPRTPRYDFRFASVTQDERTQEHWIRRIRHHAQRSLRRYSEPQGLETLREQVSAFLARHRSVFVPPEQILLVSGSQQAIDLVCRSFTRPGESSWVEGPSYQGARLAMELNHLRVHSVPVDREGLAVDSLPSNDEALVFCTPSHQVPSGRLMSAKRRAALVAWAQDCQSLILEDDYDGLPYYDPELELPALFSLAEPGRVLHVGTFSLLLFPGIRIGYVCGTPDQIKILTRARWLAGRHNPQLQQAALCDLMRSGQFDQHLERRRRLLVRRRAQLISELSQQLGERIEISGAHAGTFLTARLRSRAPRALMRALDGDPELGVEELVVPTTKGERRSRCLSLVLCYSGLLPAQISAGVSRITKHADTAEGVRR